MRIRELFVASLLTVTFGCPGDDSGDTDANTTVNDTDNTTPGTTDDTTNGTEPPPGTDSSSSGPSEGSSTSEGGAETTTSGADSGTSEGSSSGGTVNPACDTFCNDYFAACGASDANDYGDPGSCAEACAGYDQKTFDCKEYHVSMADGPDSVHCSHANLDGGGVC